MHIEGQNLFMLMKATKDMQNDPRATVVVIAVNIVLFLVQNDLILLRKKLILGMPNQHFDNPELAMNMRQLLLLCHMAIVLMKANPQGWAMVLI